MKHSNRKMPGGAGGGQRSRFHRLRAGLVLLLINLVVLLAVDWTLVRLGLLRPPVEVGNAEIGFFGDDPFHTSRDFGVVPAFADSAGISMALLGDSHSVLGPRDRALYRHQFVMESQLRQSGVPALVIAAGRGRYAPLQEYVLYTSRLRGEYAPRIVLMNFYTGNDFYDMLRPDDRPHFGRRKDGSIEICKPLWITFADPQRGSWSEESRILWAFDRLIGMVGYPRLLTRIKALAITTRGMDGNLTDIIAYLRKVNKSIEPRLGYYAGFSAQIVNQALFFHDFPKGKVEALAYLRELLRRARAENPGVMFVMAPIPSAILADAMPADIHTYWLETLERVGLNEDYVRELERDMYETLRRLSIENGWVFVDLLETIEDRKTDEQLYNSVDLHITEAACRIIGEQEAATLLETLQSGELPPESGPDR